MSEAKIGFNGSQTHARPFTYEEHVSAALDRIEAVTNNLWGLAEVCASLESRYGENIRGKFASDIGYSAEYVRKLAATWRAWENRNPSPVLSLKHHTIASRAEDPQAAIRFAEDHELSTRQLEAHVASPEPASDEVWIPCPHCDGSGRVWVKPEAP